MKKIIILFLIFSILSTISFCYTDTSDYMWAASAVDRWSNNGIISGYTDGTFKGNSNITRADLTIIANRLNNSVEKNNKRVALDISENDYFFNDVCTAVNKGLIKIDSNKNFRPREYATREDAIVIFSNLFNLTYGSNAYEYLTKNFTDGKDVSYENMNKVAGFIDAGFISGYEDGTLRPKNNITRAELIAMLDNAIKKIYSEGNYSNEVIKGSVVINDENVKIKNSEISGRIFILDGANDDLPQIINTNIGQGIISRVGNIDVVKDNKFETATEYKNDEEFTEAVLGYITYNKTDWTNTDVKATLKIQGGDYKVINNDGKNYYRFDNNGEFIFECENDGDIKKFVAKVNNIDKVVPVIKADISKMTEGLNVTVNVSNDSLSPIEKIAYMKGDVSAETAIEGTKIYSGVFTVNERGKYTIVAKDTAGNIGKKVISTEDSIYMVTFDPNGGTGTMESQGIMKETPTSLIPNTFTNSAGTFKGWATTPNGEVTYADKASITLTDNMTLYAVWDIHQYPITINAGKNGVVDPSSCTVDYGTNVVITITPDNGYMISDVILNNTTSIKDLLVDGEGNSKTYTLENISSANSINITFEAKVNNDISGANKPVIIKGLTPVNWDGEKWIEKDETTWNYNYNSVAEITHDTVLGNGDGAWANAMTEDGSIYVWIPRYSYKIESGEHRENIKSWNSVTDPGTDEDNNKGKILIKFTNGVDDDYLEDNYKAHPAFTFGDYELSGIWVAKYEASEGNTLDELEVPTKETSVVKFIPNVSSWRDITVSNAFLYSYNTFRDADSHLMKNTEWGAVAYLTNAIGRIPYSNNSYITGNSGSVSTNTWDTEKGVKASTTHNIYGIYDMSGGTAEYVAAYVDKGSSRNEIINLVRAEDKYKNVYKEEYSNEIFGDAVYETSSDGIGKNSWDYSYSNIQNTYGIFSRGGVYTYGNCGIFGFSGSFSGAATEVATFRVVLAIPTLNSTYRVIWKNDDGTILETDTGVKSGTIPVYNGVTPTKPSTSQYTYTFKGWSPEFSPITKNTTYTAQYSSTVNKYTVIWENYDGTVLETDTEVEYGTTPMYDGVMPTKPSTTQYTYVFNGWNSVISNVTGDITYTAQFITLGQTYTVTWNNYDGTVLETDAGVEYGSTPVYDGITPTKPSTAQYTYTFSGWSPVVSEVAGDVTYTAKYNSTINKYTITVTQGNNGTITPDSVTVEYGTNQTFTIVPNYGYIIDTLVVNGSSITITDEEKMTYLFNDITEDCTITATYKEAWGGWNEPAVVEGQMVPVKWNSQYNKWETTTTDDPDWYDYNSVAITSNSSVAGNGDGKWANVMTYDGLVYYNSGINEASKTTATAGSIIPAGKIIATQGSQYVWIPRYTYKITKSYGYNKDVDSWNADVGANKSGKVEIIFSKGIKDTITSTTGLSKDGYVAHPAFTLGSDELTGIWVAKYEASRNDASLTKLGSGTIVSSKPGVKSWVDISISEMFDRAYSLNRSLDSHMMKNSEWGAVAYLTNAIGRIPYINNYHQPVTGYTGASQDETSNVSNIKTYAWNTVNGVKGSTTHNVYGIYDLSGGACEYVAAYYTEGINSYLLGDVYNNYAGSLYVAANNSLTSKYVETYLDAYSDDKVGDAVYETSGRGASTTAWDSDMSHGFTPNYPIFGRGGSCRDGVNAGIFYFGSGTGQPENRVGFRTVLAIPVKR